MSGKRGLGRDMNDPESPTLGIDVAFAGYQLPPPSAIQDALRKSVDGSFRVGKFRLSSVGLQVESALNEADWREVGEFLKQADSAMQWWIGDWVNSCDAAWGETYALAVEVTGYAEKYLRNISYVARSIDLSLRRDKLSFTHHSRVAAMLPEQQREWLDYAVAEGLSDSALRKAIAGTDTEANTEASDVLDPARRIKQLETRTKAITRAVNNREKLTADERRSIRDEITVARRILDWADSLFGEE